MFLLEKWCSQTRQAGLVYKRETSPGRGLLQVPDEKPAHTLDLQLTRTVAWKMLAGNEDFYNSRKKTSLKTSDQ